ncbi:MAG TPA: DivIVA domain-containing protein [Acidimicrobiales bacterium]
MTSTAHPADAAALLAAARFPIRLRGYDPIEVDALLDDVIEAVASERQEHEAPAPTLPPPPTQHAPTDRLDELGPQIASVLEAAEQRASAMVAQARAEADRIVADAGAVFAAALIERAQAAGHLHAARTQLQAALVAVDCARDALPAPLVAASSA